MLRIVIGRQKITTFVNFSAYLFPAAVLPPPYESNKITESNKNLELFLYYIVSTDGSMVV